jgi:plastocyanin
MRFTAPQTGIYTVEATFNQADNRYDQSNPGPSSTVYVVSHGVSKGSKQIQIYGDAYVFPATDVEIDAGDTIEFVCDGTKAALIRGSIYRQSCTLAGTVVLGDYLGSPADVLLKIDVIQGTNVVRTQKVTPNSAGGFAVAEIPAGTYTVRIKSSGWLSKSTPNVVIDGPVVTMAAVTLVNGDLNGDNQIGLPDSQLLSGNFDKTGD